MALQRWEYDLCRAGILGELAGSPERFIACMTGNYVRIARAYGLNARVSKARLQDAYAFWNSDTTNTLRNGIHGGTLTLDHFKQAAFLCFWLRRMHPLENLGPRYHDVSQPMSDKRQWFSLYGNEICALHIGLKLTQFYTLQMIHKAAADCARGEKILAFPFRIEDLTTALSVTPDFEVDAVMILKHKNNSPHAINLIFKALYAGLRQRGL